MPHGPAPGGAALVTINFVLPDGTNRTLDACSGTLMEAARNAGLPGMLAECGGACACGTCHVQLCPNGLAALGPATQPERHILDFEAGATPRSRLSCQIPISSLPDGLTFTIAGDAA